MATGLCTGKRSASFREDKVADESDSKPTEPDHLSSVYPQLRALAASYLARERPDHTLQPTALVHEAYARLAASGSCPATDEPQFLSLAATVMRHVLVDHARRRRAERRGGGRTREPLDDAVVAYQHSAIDLVALDEALRQLAELNSALAQTVELRFFGGLSEQETAEQMGLSTRSVRRNWRAARAWLAHRLGPEAP